MTRIDRREVVTVSLEEAAQAAQEALLALRSGLNPTEALGLLLRSASTAWRESVEIRTPFPTRAPE